MNIWKWTQTKTTGSWGWDFEIGRYYGFMLFNKAHRRVKIRRTRLGYWSIAGFGAHLMFGADQEIPTHWSEA